MSADDLDLVTEQKEDAMVDAADWQPTRGMHSDVPEATYHSHRGSLSVSGAKLLLRSPEKFKWQQEHPVHKDVFDFGTAAHALVLGIGAPIHVVYADSWRTKDAKAEQDAARANGSTPLLEKDYQRVQQMADKLSSHSLAMRLLSEGEPEVSAYAIDEETGVMRRGRFDWLHPTLLVDYKSAASSDPAAWAGRYGVVNKFGYGMQAAWYTDLARALGHPAQAFAFIAQEKEAPYSVSVVYVDDADLYDARAKNQAALERFRDCTATGIWPGYLPDDTAARLSLDNQTYEEEVI